MLLWCKRSPTSSVWESTEEEAALWEGAPVHSLGTEETVLPG